MTDKPMTLPPAQAEAMARAYDPVWWGYYDRNSTIPRSEPLDWPAKADMEPEKAIRIAKAQAAWAASPGPAAYEALVPFNNIFECGCTFGPEDGLGGVAADGDVWFQNDGCILTIGHFRRVHSTLLLLQGRDEG